MNNLNCLSPVDLTNAAQHSFETTNDLEKFPAKNSINTAITIGKARITDAELFSTYRPVNNESILPVHQLLF